MVRREKPLAATLLMTVILAATPAGLPAPPPPPLQASPAPRKVQQPTGPAVDYFGLAEGPAGTYVVLRVDGQLHVVQPGQTVAGVRVLSATPERVQIRTSTTVRDVYRLKPGGRTGP